MRYNWSDVLFKQSIALPSFKINAVFLAFIKLYPKWIRYFIFQTYNFTYILFLFFSFKKKSIPSDGKIRTHLFIDGIYRTWVIWSDHMDRLLSFMPQQNFSSQGNCTIADLIYPTVQSLLRSQRSHTVCNRALIDISLKHDPSAVFIADYMELISFHVLIFLVILPWTYCINLCHC